MDSTTNLLQGTLILGECSKNNPNIEALPRLKASDLTNSNNEKAVSAAGFDELVKYKK